MNNMKGSYITDGDSVGNQRLDQIQKCDARHKHKEDSNDTWSGAFCFRLPCVAEAYGAVWLRESQEALAKVINPLVQFIWYVGCLEDHHTHTFI